MAMRGLALRSALAVVIIAAMASDARAQEANAVAALATPETAETLATFYWSLYQSLLDKGFTQDQAMQITASQGSVFEANPAR